MILQKKVACVIDWEEISTNLFFVVEKISTNLVETAFLNCAWKYRRE
jgi:hypothetical protein